MQAYQEVDPGPSVQNFLIVHAVYRCIYSRNMIQLIKEYRLVNYSTECGAKKRHMHTNKMRCISRG